MMFLIVLDIGNHILVALYWSLSYIEYMNKNSAMMDQKSIRQCKADQARILEQFNTPYYSILVRVKRRVVNIAGVWSREYVVIRTSWSNVLGDRFWVFYY